MNIVVQKYGGTSVKDAYRIKNVARRAIDTKNKGNKVVVVVSAMGDTTDELIELSNKVSNRPSKREMDMLLSTGEQVSMSLLAMAIDSYGEKAISLTGGQAGIFTDSSHSKARILDVSAQRIKDELENGNIVIVAGFQGQNENNDITTLGRGGSDTTAVSIAASLGADVCEIYTDVDGVYACDPRIVPNIKKLKNVSYDEMLELAVLGAKVLHSRSVEVAKTHNVEIKVRSSFNFNEGTSVKEGKNMEHDGLITGIAHDLDVAKVVVFGVPDKPGVASKIFKTLAEKNIVVQMIVQSAQVENVNDIAFTCSLEDAKEAKIVLKKVAEEIGAKSVSITEDLGKVSIVGEGMMTHSNIAARMFAVLADNRINIDMISTSEITISVIIDSKEVNSAVSTLAEEFSLVEK